MHTARKLGPEQGTSAIDHALGNEEFPCVGICLHGGKEAHLNFVGWDKRSGAWQTRDSN